MAFTRQVKILSRLLAYLLKRKQHLKRELGQKIEAAHATAEIEKLHPTGRGLDNGFFDLSADAIK